MDYQKQLIKAITDLTKAVDRNTNAIRENTELGNVDINTVESGAPDDLKTIKLNFGTGSAMYSGSWESPKGIQRIDADNKEIPYLNFGARTGITSEVSHSGVCDSNCGCNEK